MKTKLPSLTRLSQFLYCFALFLICSNMSWGQITVFTDDFNYNVTTRPNVSPGGSPTMTYTTTLTSANAFANLTTNSNKLTLSNGSSSQTAGKDYVVGNLATFNSAYNATLNSNTGLITWSFSLRNSSSKTAASFYAVPTANTTPGVILVASDADLIGSSTKGYIITVGSDNPNTGYAAGTATNKLSLSSFTTGIGSAPTTVPVTFLSTASGIAASAAYISVIVTYNPTNDEWSVSYKVDSSMQTTFPTSGFSTAVTATDNTNTGEAMNSFAYYMNGVAGNNTVQFENFKVVVGPSLSPVITAPSPTSSLTGLDYFTGAGPSTPAKTFTIGGSNLTADIILTPTTTDYELSTDGSTFSNTLNLTPTSGTVASTTIYARLKVGLSNNTYNATVNITSTGATAQSVTLSGAVTAPSPTITLSATSLTAFAATAVGTPTASQNFTATGIYLTNDVTITAPTNFEVSTDDSSFSSSVILAQSGGNVATTTIYVRYNPTGNADGTNTIVASSTGATTKNVTVSNGGLTKYYYNGSADLSLTSSWSGNAAGTGTAHPLNFTTAGISYVFASNATTTADWIVSGAGSKIFVGDPTLAGVTLDITNGNTITGTIDIPNALSGSNKVWARDFLLAGGNCTTTFGTMHASSEVHYQTNVVNTSNAASRVPNSQNYTYGNLFIESGLQINSYASPMTVQTSLTVAEGATFFISGTTTIQVRFNTGAVANINGRIMINNENGFVAGSVSSFGPTFPSLQFVDAIAIGTNLNFGANSWVDFNKYQGGGTNTKFKITPMTYLNLAIISNNNGTYTSSCAKELGGDVTVTGKFHYNIEETNTNNAYINTFSNNGYNINIANDATIIRTLGILPTAPIFAGTVNVLYNGTTAITSGVEIPTATSVLNNLEINNAGGVTLTAATAVNNMLTLTAGNLATGDFLTLKSNATKTAVVAPVLGSISGNATAERFIPSGHRAYRLLSPPTTGGTLHSNWQENQADGVNGNAGFGTHLTGAGGSANGFDTTTNNAPSIFTHNNVTPAYTALANTSGTMSAGSPYLVYVRGSRQGSNITSLSNDATTLRSTGTLYTGDLTVSGLNATADGFSVVGNPYQAQVDVQAVLSAATNLNTGYYYVLDPSLGAKGAYIPVDVTAAATAHVSKYVQPGQAFFVKTVAAGAASLTFTEANKSTAEAQTTIFRNANSSTSFSGINLTLLNATTSNTLDIAKIVFNGSETNDINQNDALKLTNFDENMSTANNGNLVSIEKRALPVLTDEIPLNITNYKVSNYILKVDGSSLTETPFLIDNFTNSATEILLNGTINYAFTVDVANTATTAANRFKIVYTSPLSTEQNSIAAFTLYPNPSTTNSFNVVIPESMNNASLTVSNLLGQKLYTQNNLQSGTTENIMVSNVKDTGVYLITLTSEGRTTTTKWIVK